MKHIPAPHYVTDEEHSRFSPSGAKRWIKCPASISFLDSIKRLPSKPNPYAEEGTAAHELAAYCLERDISPQKCVGMKFNNHIVDNEMARQVEKYTTYVQGAVTWDATLWVENKLSMESIHPDVFGTADAIIVSKDYLEIVDLKYGKGVVVEVEENSQLAVYAIGALSHLAKYGVKYSDDFEVKLTIAQPRAPHADGPIRSTTLTVAQLRDFKEIAKTAVKVSERSDAPFGPSADTCRWCEGAPTCRALANYNLEVARLEFADLLESPLSVKQKLPSINELSEEELAQILKHSKAIEQWLNAAVEKATSLLRADVKVPGYKLVYGRSNRAWLREAEVEERLSDYGTNLDRMYEKKFLSPTKAEKELTDAEWELVKDLVYKPTGKVTIAPESDGRPAINPHEAAKDDWTKEEVEF